MAKVRKKNCPTLGGQQETSQIAPQPTNKSHMDRDMRWSGWDKSCISISAVTWEWVHTLQNSIIAAKHFSGSEGQSQPLFSR